MAETGQGSPNPSRANAWISCSRESLSTLLTTRITGTSARCSTRATRASSSVMPVVTSTTSSTRSAALIAASACAVTFAASAGGSFVSPASPGRSQPPVSTSTNARPVHSATSSRRSRVTPGRSSTIASRVPMMRLTSDDLPTLGRPTTAIRGRSAVSHRSSSAHERGAVGCDDLDRARQHGHRLAVEEATARRARRRAAGSGRLRARSPAPSRRRPRSAAR